MWNFIQKLDPLYLETDTSGICLGAKLLQVREGMNCGHDKIPDNAILFTTAFTSKSLSSAEWHYINIQCEALWILQGIEKFHHYCFMREVYIITNHKPLVAILSKGLATLCQQL